MPFSLLVLTPIVAGPATAPLVMPVRAAPAPRIDGRVDDSAWTGAPPFTGFVQKFPAEGASPAEPTTVRVLYDDDALYVAIDCVQVHEPVTARLTRRDRVVESDRVVVSLDTMLDHKSAYQFEVNAGGVQVDALQYGDTEISYDWDDVWQAAVARRADGWSAELRIPLQLLRFRSIAAETWGFQIRRYTAASQEIDELAFIPRDQGGEVSRFGRLGPFDHLKKPLGVELRPFAAAQLTHRDPGEDSLERGFGAAASAGLDGKWRLSPSATLDFTAAPDFAQVEVDQVVLNLTTYETFFPEKRPFFLEGLDLFAT